MYLMIEVTCNFSSPELQKFDMAVPVIQLRAEIEVKDGVDFPSLFSDLEDQMNTAVEWYGDAEVTLPDGADSAAEAFELANKVFKEMSKRLAAA